MKKTIPVLITALLFSCVFRNNRVAVINRSGSELRDVTVSVCDSTWRIPLLEPGEEKLFTAVYTRDDHFTVEHGDTVENFGYVTHGISGEFAEIVFTPSGIAFQQTGSSEY